MDTSGTVSMDTLMHINTQAPWATEIQRAPWATELERGME